MSGPERRSALSVSLTAGSGLWIVCHAYQDTAPILSIAGAGVHLTVTPPARAAVSSADVATARELVQAAGTYLRECERLAANSTPQVAA